MMKLANLSLLSLALSGCSGPYQAPYGSVISDLDDFKMVPSTAHQSQDGVGTLVFGDVLVYDDETDVPLNDVEVEILTGWSGIYVLPESAIKLVSYPSAPADVADGTATPADYCDIDPEDGFIDDDAPDWCSWWWDTESGFFYEFGGDYAMTSENYQPTYMIGSTDNRGIMRFYLYVDSLPFDSEDETFSNGSIWISIGVDQLSVTIDVE